MNVVDQKRVLNKTMWLLEHYSLNNYYEKVSIVKIGLFPSEQLAKEYAKSVLGCDEEGFVWSCNLDEIKVIEIINPNL